MRERNVPDCYDAGYNLSSFICEFVAFIVSGLLILFAVAKLDSSISKTQSFIRTQLIDRLGNGTSKSKNKHLIYNKIALA